MLFRKPTTLASLLVLFAAITSAGVSGCGGGGGENQVGVSETGMTDEEMEAYSAEADALNEQ